MAWTTPKTWSAGEVLTAANFNAQIRDNLNSLFHLVARKTADESVVSSTAFQDDDHLILPVLANEVWQFELTLLTTGLFGFKGQLTSPGGTIAGTFYGLDESAALAMTSISGSSPSATWTQRADSTTIPRVGVVTGVFSNGGSGGNLRLQWAQGTSGATPTVLRAQSTLWGAKLA
jgi:hypothetical protein